MSSGSGSSTSLLRAHPGNLGQSGRPGRVVGGLLVALALLPVACGGSGGFSESPPGSDVASSVPRDVGSSRDTGGGTGLFVVQIASPEPGQVFGPAGAVDLFADVLYTGDMGELVGVWESSADGELGDSRPDGRGRAVLLGVTLSQGEHVIRLTVRHQSGPADEEDTRARYAACHLEAEVLPFVEDMAHAYRRADLVIARSGATTVAELAATGRPALLVPFPYAADDHQAANAAALVRAGAARMVRQEDWDEAGLAIELREILSTATLRRMAVRARERALPDAARRVADLVIEAGGLA